MAGLMTSLRQKGVCLAALDVSVRTPSLRDAEAIAHLLCKDDVLRQSLGVGLGDNPNARSFLDKISRWCEQTNSITMVIVDADGLAVGTISLSNVNEGECSGGIGYWLASDHWGRGYVSRAFALTLWLARTHGIKRIFARVGRENTPSLRIWQRYAAAEIPTSCDMLECMIDLHNTAPAYTRLLANLHEMGFPREGGDEASRISEDLRP
jgi:ribosomal-protein-alanine N-acetyltransferase